MPKPRHPRRGLPKHTDMVEAMEAIDRKRSGRRVPGNASTSEIQFMALPVTFKFAYDYHRSKTKTLSVRHPNDLDEALHHLSEGERETFKKSKTITIVGQTRSLLGIRWKTDDGRRFTTEELNSLIGMRIIDPA